MITVKLLTHSVNPLGMELLTFLLKYPRFIHAEFMTHVAFSRNAASSRAIPFSIMLKEVINSPAIPEFWGSAKPGMQSGAALTGFFLSVVQWLWITARWPVCGFAWLLNKCGLHKQLTSRLLEPWGHITVIMTTAEAGLDNFFALRANAAAQPEFQVLAYRMLDKVENSVPQAIAWGGWHLGFSDPGQDWRPIEDQISVSVARACWISYNKHGKTEFDLADAKNRYDECIKFGHMSPLQHVAQAVHPMDFRYRLSNYDIGREHQCNVGWLQLRKTIPGECRIANYEEIMMAKPDWIKL